MDRRGMKKTVSVLLSLVMMTGVLGGCSSDSVNTELNIALNDSPSTVDPQLTYEINTNNVISFFVATLYEYTPDHELVPCLAESSEVSDDGLIYTFHLKEGLKWSDGRPLLAEDFVFAMQRLADPDVGSNSVYLITDSCMVKNAREINTGKMPVNELGVRALDDRTLIVELEAPCPYFRALVTLPNFSPCCEDYYHVVGEDYAKRADTMLYAGPYIMDRYEPLAMQIHLTKNPYYLNADNISIEGITLQVINANQQAVMCYESGVVDITQITGELTELTEGDPELHVYPQAMLSFIDINHGTNPALKNRNIRMALSKSIDRVSLVENLLRTGYSSITRIIPPGFYKDPDGSDFAGDRTMYDEYAVYDTDEAKRLWELGLSELGISSLTLNFVYATTSGDVAEAICAQMEKALPGLKIELKPVPRKEHSRIRMSGDFDMIMVGWVADYSDPTAFLSCFLSTDHTNSYNDPDYEALIERCQSAEVANNNEERVNLMHRAEEMLMEDAAVIPLWTVGRSYLVHEGVEGFRLTPTGTGFVVTGLTKEVR